jgi:HEPN domain-containing protein
MSEYQFDRDEWKRYLKQGNHTLKSARGDMDEGDYDWACFKAQQSAELFLKGFLRAIGTTATGHSITRLLDMIEENIIAAPDDIRKCSLKLDKVYIPTRYPDAYAWGSPVDYYTEDDAKETIDCAERILKFVNEIINA